MLISGARLEAFFLLTFDIFMKLLTIVIIALSFCVVFAQGNDWDKELKTADKFKFESQYDSAAKYYKRYIQKDSLCSRVKIEACYNAGLSYQSLNKFLSAAKYFDAGIKCLSGMPADSLIYRLYYSRGEIYDELSNPDSAVLCYKEAYKWAGMMNNISFKAKALDQIGFVNLSQGNISAGIDSMKSALEISRALNDTLMTLEFLNNLGYAYYSANSYDKALKLYNETLEYALVCKSEKELYIYYNNLGTVNFSLGEYEKAAENFEKALELNRKYNPADKIAVRLNNLGMTYQRLAQYNKAMKYYEEALELGEKSEFEENVYIVLSNIGSLARIQKKYEKAMECYRKVLAKDKKRKNKKEIAADLNNMAFVYLELSQNDSAKACLNEALTYIAEKGMGEVKEAVYKNLGEVYFNSGEYEKSIGYLKSAVEILEKIRLSVSGSARRSYLSSIIEAYRFLVAAYVRNNQNDKAVSIAELSTARYLSEQLGNSKSGDSVFSLADNGFVKNIPKNSAIIYFSNIDYRGRIIKFVIDDEGLTAFEQAAGNALNLLDTASEKIITDYFNSTYPALYTIRPDMMQITHFYRLLLSKQDLTMEEIKLRKLLGRVLYMFAMGDIESRIKNKKELIIVPGENLSLIPFETLTGADGKYLAENYDIRYVPSLTAADLISKREYDKERKSLIAFGGAVYDSLTYEQSKKNADDYLGGARGKIITAMNKKENLAGEYAAIGYGKMSNLPASLEELEVLGKIYKDGRIIKGGDVNEAEVKSLSVSGELAKYKVIHFATHAIVVPALPELSALVLSQTKNAGEDGFLRLQEIAELRLKADFVNLSACETGLGKVFKGEGTVGLTQSFLLAGANSVAVSLWEIDDKATKEFMTDMYKNAGSFSVPFYLALSRAKRDFIKSEKFSDPFYWAPFVYWGR